MAENKKEALNPLSYGWCGKILKVDLSSEVITEIDTQPYADRFLGGRGIATRLYWENVPATCIIDRTYVKDSLGLCDSCWPLMFSHHTDDKVGDSTLEACTFNAVTGKEIDEDALLKFGEIIFNQQRAILLREGWNPRKDDTIADFNFTDPVQSVFMNDEVLVPGEGNIVLNRKGQTLDREVFKKMRDEFYQLRGWDPETGYPGTKKLHELGLLDVIG